MPISYARRTRVTLALTLSNYPNLLVRAHAIYNAMLLNAAMFPGANPAMAILLALVMGFDVAQQATATKAKGTIATRNAKAALLITALESEETYVQGLCDAHPEQAMQLIAGAAMVVVGVPTHQKPLLEAKLVPATPGTIHVSANAKILLAGSRKRPTFNWQSSIDGGKTWTPSQSTPHATIEIANLPLLGNAAFRVSVTLGKITGPWSQVASIFVH